MNIPKHAKPVFKGIRFTIFQWEQTLFDGSKATFEAAMRLNSVRAIVVAENNTILINNEEQPESEKMVMLPGGIVEDGESPETAMRRELLEETGYECGTLDLFMTEGAGYQLQCDRFTFIARDCKKVHAPKHDPGERVELLELSLDAFMDGVLSGEIGSEGLQKHFLIEHMKNPNLTELKRRILGCKN